MTIKLYDKSYEVPLTWSEVTYLNYAQSKTPDLSLERKLSYQTTIPAEILSKLPLSALKQLIGLVEFQDTEPEFFEQVTSDIQVGNEHYIKIEQARIALEKNTNEWLAAIDIVKIYTKEDISNLPVTSGLGVAVFFLNRLKSSSSDTKPSENTSRTKTHSTQG